jgi:KaiC/GvpD/RAD55 family RecA-like ATPase
MVKIGQEFVVNGKKYAYTGITSGGSVLAYRLKDMSPRRFKTTLTLDKVQELSTDNVHQDVIDLVEKEKQEELERKQTMHSMTKGQIFVGNDGNRYVFDSVRRTRFNLTSLDGERKYTANATFIKEVLDEYKE